MITILRIRLKLYIHELSIFFGLLAMSILFTFIFGASFKSNYKPLICIVDQDQSYLSQTFVESLNYNTTIKTLITDEETASKHVKSDKAIASILFEKGFNDAFNHNQAKVTLVKTKDIAEIYLVKNIIQKTAFTINHDTLVYNSTLNYLRQNEIQINEKSLMDSISKTAKDSWNKKLTYHLNSYFHNHYVADENATLKHYLIGYALMFSIFFVFFGIGSIIDEKRNYVWQRQIVSPISRLSVTTGNMIATTFMGFLQIFFMVYGGKFLFGIDWGQHDLSVLIVLTAFVFSTTCLGLLIASLVKTQQQLSSIVPIITVGTSMLGGCMWSLEMIDSKILLFLADLTPQKWALQSIEKMVIYGYGMEIILLPISILILMGIVYLLLAWSFTRKRA